MGVGTTLHVSPYREPTFAPSLKLMLDVGGSVEQQAQGSRVKWAGNVALGLDVFELNSLGRSGSGSARIGLEAGHFDRAYASAVLSLANNLDGENKFRERVDLLVGTELGRGARSSIGARVGFESMEAGGCGLNLSAKVFGPGDELVISAGLSVTLWGLL